MKGEGKTNRGIAEHLGIEDAQDEPGRRAEMKAPREEIAKPGGEKMQEMFRVTG